MRMTKNIKTITKYRVEIPAKSIRNNGTSLRALVIFNRNFLVRES